MAKEEPAFWEKLGDMIEFDSQRTLLADDNEGVLRSAKEHGIANLVYVARPSSQSPISYSREFSSIVYFKELIV
jgi:putative hydrolase of the HAD superfamily